MSGMLSFVLRTLLGSEGVMQRLHFLVGFLQQRVSQCNACLQSIWPLSQRTRCGASAPRTSLLCVLPAWGRQVVVL